MKSVIPWTVVPIAMLCFQAAPAAEEAGDRPSSAAELLLAQSGRTCKQARSCREAVEMWCAGYSRADADHDGIPCENICHSKEEVDRIREEIGC